MWWFRNRKLREIQDNFLKELSRTLAATRLAESEFFNRRMDNPSKSDLDIAHYDHLLEPEFWLSKSPGAIRGLSKEDKSLLRASLERHLAGEGAAELSRAARHVFCASGLDVPEHIFQVSSGTIMAFFDGIAGKSDWNWKPLIAAASKPEADPDPSHVRPSPYADETPYPPARDNEQARRATGLQQLLAPRIDHLVHDKLLPFARSALKSNLLKVVAIPVSYWARDGNFTSYIWRVQALDTDTPVILTDLTWEKSTGHCVGTKLFFSVEKESVKALYREIYDEQTLLKEPKLMFTFVGPSDQMLA